MSRRCDQLLDHYLDVVVPHFWFMHTIYGEDLIRPYVYIIETVP